MPAPSSRPRRRPLFFTRAALVVLAVVLFVLVAGLVLKVRGEDAAAAVAAGRYSPPPFSAPVRVDQIVSVIGDGLAGPTPHASATAAWPALVARDLKLVSFVQVTDGGGYVTVGRPDTTRFLDHASQVAPGARVVVVVGGAADVGADEFVRLQDIAQTFAEVRRVAPNARIVVVGPVYDGDAADAPAALVSLRNDIRVEVTAQQSVFVDPLSGNWAPQGSKYLTQKGTAWTASGQRMVADRLERVLEPLVRGG